VLAIGMFFAFKIFMLQLELGLIVMLSPLSFSFLGLNALKDQGIAPFKALISLSYRIILMTIILSAFTEVSTVASNSLSGLSAGAFKDGIGKALMTVLSALGAYMVLAFLVYKSDSIASSLAGGSTNMGTGDIAGAAAAGAAAGAAIASGGAAAAATGGQLPQSMANFMKGMGSSITNASGSGRGQTPDAPPTRSPLSSSGPSNQGVASTPERPGEQPAPSANNEVPSASGGAPVRPGSGTAAGIGNNDDSNLANQHNQQPKQKPSFLDTLKDANHHISQEKSATHVSINTSNSD
jgi:type IV secretion system protein TrbL